jgi:TonB family protein
LELVISLDHAIDSPEHAQATLSRVFALNTNDFLDSLPEFWRGSLTNQLIYDPSQKQESEFRWQLPPPPPTIRSPAEKAAPDEIDREGVFHVGPDITAPKATFTPEPEYSAIARYEKFEGTLVVNLIVGTDGNVHYIRLVRPLGLGLDEAARSVIQTWRFLPSTRKGEPVAVEMNIEVTFNLH